jgi:hypothetical protein
MLFLKKNVLPAHLRDPAGPGESILDFSNTPAEGPATEGFQKIGPQTCAASKALEGKRRAVFEFIDAIKIRTLSLERAVGMAAW